MDPNRILVVDDEIVIRALLEDILTGEGYQVDTASDAREALGLLHKHEDFVVLFTDIMMPEMDGIALIRESRKFRPSLIPIVMTGFATLETARGAVKEGAYDYVLKPFSLSEVKIAVSNAIERYRLENENARLREVTELFNISESIAAIRSERDLLNFVLRAALEHVGARRGSIMVTTADGCGLQIATSVGISEEHTRAPVEIGTGISGWVAKNAKPLLVADITKDPELMKISLQLADTSFVSVPLERKHPPSDNGLASASNYPRVVAVLNVNAKQNGRPFSETDLKILSIVANHAAAALENVRLIRDVEDAHLSTIQSMALLLDAKDPYTQGHSERVRIYSVMAARRMGMPESDIHALRLGAALHDVGKVGVKDSLLNKNGSPTSDEWEMVKRHPIVGYEVLLPVRILTKEHLALVRSHHERIDGAGYPDGLQGDQIPLVVRVLTVADSYDAMSSRRPYRPPLSPATIIEQLQRYSGSQFDPNVAKVFINLIEEGEVPRQE